MRPREVPTYAGSPVCSVPLAGAPNGVSLSLGFAPGPKRQLLQTFIDACAAFFESADKGDLIVTDPG